MGELEGNIYVKKQENNLILEIKQKLVKLNFYISQWYCSPNVNNNKGVNYKYLYSGNEITSEETRTQ